jgi:hypothetical protein
MIKKIPNKPLKCLDQPKLLSAISDHVRMMICANFDRFWPDADAQLAEKNVHVAQITAQALAERAMELIGKNYTPNNGFDAQHPPNLHDLGGLLANAAATARNDWKVGDDPSFKSAVMSCADHILVDLLIEPEV